MIPCCYEYGLDMTRVAQYTDQSADQIVAHHTGSEYIVYAIGFCPGFPYLGYVPPEISVRTSARHTPHECRCRKRWHNRATNGDLHRSAVPGGWNIIGRTPLELVNVADGYFPLRTGDRVRFRRIDEQDFQRLAGERIPPRTPRETINRKRALRRWDEFTGYGAAVRVSD